MALLNILTMNIRIIINASGFVRKDEPLLYSFFFFGIQEKSKQSRQQKTLGKSPTPPLFLGGFTLNNLAHYTGYEDLRGLTHFKFGKFNDPKKC